MNAGGVDKACKSSGSRKGSAADEVVIIKYAPWARAELSERIGNSRESRKSKDLSPWERLDRYQLVGKVTAYQGYDA